MSQASKNAASALPKKLPHFDWTRFWCPIGGQIRLDFDGYLLDPDGKYGATLNPELVRFSDVVGKRCVGLLGEPGIGKTDALAAVRKSIEAQLSQSGALIEWIELQAYQSQDLLDRELFGSETFGNWLAGERDLHLFLDGLDESLLLIRSLASFLVERFKRGRYPTARLWIRIACRTAEWPTLLTDYFRTCWTEDQIGLFELAPLRRADVQMAAQQAIGTFGGFLDGVARAEAVPLAIKPVTLNMLLRQYIRDGRLPDSKLELYRSGCELLATESSLSRQAARLTGTLSGRKRAIVAGRIASTSFFCRRPVIWTGKDAAGREVGDIILSELAGGTEESNGEPFKVDEPEIEEVISTGLFRFRGADRMGWAHQTYGEFLAAYYLHLRELPRQVLPLISQVVGGRLAVVPQLREIAAWLSTMRQDVFDALVQDDPGAILGSDVGLRRPTAGPACRVAPQSNRVGFGT